MQWSWPVPGFVPWELPQKDHPGAFGAVRKHDIHTGVDLYCPEGTPVHAVAEGLVVGEGWFTGPLADSPWWLPTRYLMVEGASGVVCYGEIEPEVTVGAQVRQGQRLGKVVAVLRTDKGKPRSMLHLELYEKGAREPLWWVQGQPPATLRDPTPHLLKAWARVTTRFHRDAKPAPTDPAERRALVKWLLSHPLWRHPFRLTKSGNGDLMDRLFGDKDEIVAEMGSLQECACFDFVYVDPTTEMWSEDESQNTAFRVWVEAGGWIDLSAERENPYLEPEGGWHEGNRWQVCHDIDLDCSGADMEEALVNLALRVRWFYGDTREGREDIPQDCLRATDWKAPCEETLDGFCAKCGYLI